MSRTMMDDAVCPACAHKGLEYTAEQIDMPYLGDSLQTMLRCKECGYRHTDFILTESSDPVRLKYTIQDEAAMSVRVVRSASGTVRIPEMGIDIEPGMASDAYITNVEGILVRIEGVLDQLLRDSEEPATKLAIEKMMEQFQLMRDGKAEPATLIIEDPFGNSAIIADSTETEVLSPEEAEKLATGMFIFGPDGALISD